MLAHHGLGEELVLYALASSGAAAPLAVVVWRARLARFGRWLRRH